MVEMNNPIEEKKLPLGVKILGSIWMSCFAIFSLLILYDLFNILKNVGRLEGFEVLGVFQLVIIIYCIFSTFSIFKFGEQSRKFLISLSVWVLLISILNLFVSYTYLSITELVLIFLAMGFSVITIIYLGFSEKVKEAFKK